MDGFIILILLIGLALFGGSIISFVNLSSISKLRTEIDRLNRIVNYQREQIAKLIKLSEQGLKDNETQSDTSHIQATKEKSEENTETKEKQTQQNLAAKSAQPSLQLESQAITQAPVSKAPVNQASASKTAEQNKPTPKSKPSFDFEKFMMGNGLLWLGGIILAFGGVFLAKYSIEAGLFPPALRIILGSIFGLALIGGAEYLRKNPTKFQITTPLIGASLASGGLVTCFAMAYVAFDFYQFLSPMLAFIVLALIATAGTVLSLRYGPILALIGLLGAYAVPVLVSTGSNNIFALLVYVAFVSASAVWVHSIVKQTWLWYLTLIANMGWLFISLVIGEAQHAWIIFAFSIVSVYLYVIVPVLGWTLSQSYLHAMPVKTLLMPRKEQLGIFIPMIAIAGMFLVYEYQGDFLVMLTIASIILLALPFRHSAFDTWPYIALGLTVIMFFVMPSTYDVTDNLFPFTNGYLLIQIASIAAIAYCMFAIKLCPLRPSYLLLLVLAPLGLMGLAYAISDAAHSTYLYPLWSIELMIVASVFAFLAYKSEALMHKMSFLLLANGALTLTFTMLLSPSVLSLAIVVQIALMTFLSNRYHLVLPSWIYKIAIAAVIFRLSLAPWLPEYADEQVFGLHWSLVIYPLVIVLMWFANTHQQDTDLRAWCTGAILHIIALLVTTETSYLISGNYPNFAALSFTENVLMSMNWLILCILYVWRAKHSQQKSVASQSSISPIIAKVYTLYAFLLGFACITIHAEISFFFNPFIAYQKTGDGFLINWLAPMWLAPSLLLYVCIHFALVHEKLVKLTWVGIGVFAAMYINGIIRGAYHPVLSFLDAGVGQQELYVYSLVWLAISILLIVLGQQKHSNKLNKIGFAILAVVIIKAFIVDMSNLDGLYRAISFIGLGLSLVGIGWLFQRLNSQTRNIKNDKNFSGAES